MNGTRMIVTGTLCGSAAPMSVDIQGGRIASIRPGLAPDALGGADTMISAGWHDIQVNGYAGNDCNAGSWGIVSPRQPDLDALTLDLARHGVALFCPTVITDSPEAMEHSLRRIATAMASDGPFRRAATGIHLEGPFLSPDDGPRGAHPLEHVRPPCWDEFQRLQEAAIGHIRICTLAPELPGAIDLIERLTASGVVAAIGHTGASPACIRDAVAAGARLSTHIGNGCHAALPRHDSYLWEQLAEDRLTATMIIDGYHLQPAEAKVFVRAKGSERTILISDAVTLGGMPPGLYAEGRFEVKPDGHIVLAGTPYLAGAAALLDACMANAVRWTDLSLTEVIETVTHTPAHLLSAQRKGAVREGYDADLTLFRVPSEGPLDVIATIADGVVVYRRDAPQ